MRGGGQKLERALRGEIQCVTDNVYTKKKKKKKIFRGGRRGLLTAGTL